MKGKFLDKSGKEKKQIELPKCFSMRIRKDILLKVFEAQKGIHSQAYGSMEGAGAQYSASGISKKRRHAWKATYGKGISRIPRKIMSRHGASFNWIGATVSSTRGGRRAHPPKAEKNLFKKINKKELRLAFCSALSWRGKDIIVFDNGVLDLKSKEFFGILGKIFGKNVKILKEKSVRAGRGKMRGRKYKSNAGLLFVVGNDEKMKRSGIDVVRVGDLDIRDLAPNGEIGRRVVYSEKAIGELGERFDLEKIGSRMDTDGYGLDKKKLRGGKE